MSLRQKFHFATLPVLAFLAASPGAEACDCIGGVIEILVNDQVDVPTNAVLAVHLTDWYNERGATLEQPPPADRDLINLEVFASYGTPTAETIQLRTPVELTPNTWYTLRFGDDGLNFTTGAGPDHIPPTAPRLVVETHVSPPPTYLCGGYPVGCPGKVELFVTDPEATQSSDYYLEARLLADDREWSGFFGARTVHIGSGDCIYSLQEIDTIDEAVLQLRRWDLGGNTSPWSEPLDIIVPKQAPSPPEECHEHDDCGCSTSAPTGPLWVLVPLGWSRRRRTQRV
jgi:hypothetical protein